MTRRVGDKWPASDGWSETLTIHTVAATVVETGSALAVAGHEKKAGLKRTVSLFRLVVEMDGGQVVRLPDQSWDSLLGTVAALQVAGSDLQRPHATSHRGRCWLSTISTPSSSWSRATSTPG